MRTFYNRFYKISDNEKISDRVMTCRVITMVICILFCLTAMGFVAYSYFDFDISSKTNHVESATFDTPVTISYKDTANQSKTESLTKSSDNNYTAQLDKDVEYTVKLDKNGSAETGFCVITIEGEEKTYHTVQLGFDNNTSRVSLTFKIINKKDDKAMVTFTPHWGTSSYYSAYNGGTANEFYVDEGKIIEINNQAAGS